MNIINATSESIKDIQGAYKHTSLIALLGWQDIRQRYRRSLLGPFWLTISTGVLITIIGLVFGQILKSPIEEFLPFLATGIILWGFIASCLTEGCTGFIAAEGIIKQLPIPLPTHIFRIIWKNTIILAHNFIIIPPMFLFFDVQMNSSSLLFFAGFILLVVNLSWASLLLGALCTRFRDFPQVITNLIQVMFYLTPIIWMPHLISGRSQLLLLDLNPFYHLIEVVRAPLLGQAPTMTNWMTCISMAVIGWCVTLIVYGRLKKRIAYWL